MKLTDYITGNRKGREARRIEREAMDDPFLRDALEGYDCVPGDPADAIRRMQNRVAGVSGKLRRRLYRSAAAAAVLLCAGVGGYLLMRQAPGATEPIVLRQDTFELFVPAGPPADSVILADATTGMPRQEEESSKEKTLTGDRKTGNVSGEPDLSGQKAGLPESEASRPTATDTRQQQEQEPATASAPQAETTRQLIADYISGQNDEPGKIHSFAQEPAAALKETARKVRKAHKGATIRGHISAVDGAPLIGVPIASATGKKTNTDIDGNFSLDNTPENDTLEINYLGFITKKVAVDTSAPMQITLLSDGESPGDIVVTGYGTIKPDGQQQEPRKPVPVNGEKAYLRYLNENKTYPTDAPELPHGKVTLRFIISHEGRPVDIKVIRSLDPAADREAVRLVKEGPDWKPGDVPVLLDIRF